MHNVLTLALALAASTASLSAGAVAAEDRSRADAAPDSGTHRHRGFYLRLTHGMAAGTTSYEAPSSTGASPEVNTLGAGSQTEIAIGAAVVENLIVHGNLQLTYLAGLKKRGGGMHYDSDRDDDVGTLVGFFGGGLTYYVMPANVYFTGSIGAGGLSELKGPRHEVYESDIGLASALGIGKEWWVGRDWGMGVALTGTYYRAGFSVDGEDSVYRGYTAGLAFSATYN